MPARLPVLLVALVVGGAMAGCAGDATDEPLRTGASTSGATVDPTPFVTPTPRPTSQRWHFHDYWKGSPTIVLADQHVNLTPTVGADGLPALSAIVALPNGVIVPAETGVLTVNVTWEATAPGGAINVTYKPADSNGFFGAGNVTNGSPASIATTESMCDVPHRQESLWRFNLTAVPDGVPPGFPASREVRVNISATIGRPLFIDPPHVNWWVEGGSVLPLVQDAKGDVATAVTPAGNLSLVGAGPDATPEARVVVVHGDAGRIVPEGAKTVVAVLNWTSQAPNAKLALKYKEGNLPSEGPMSLLKDGAGSRVFSIDVRAPMTDTTYSNRTTWEFHVVPEGQAPAFQGSFTLTAWVTELSAAESLAALGLG